MKPFEVKVTAKKVRRRKFLFRVTGVVTSISIVLLLAFYGFVYLSDSFGSFTVKLDKLDPEKCLSLSETKGFENPRTMLSGPPIRDMTNITEAWLPDDVNDIDGSHNGEDYLAYTFYLKNAGTKSFDYTSTIDITKMYKNVDDAIRVKVYKNDVSTTYAKRQKGSDEPEPDTTPFYSGTQILNVVNEGLEPNQIDKYTVVVWLEGEDPECINDILGGFIKLRMHFKIVDED